jgi:hypothetical protein
VSSRSLDKRYGETGKLGNFINGTGPMYHNKVKTFDKEKKETSFQTERMIYIYREKYTGTGKVRDVFRPLSLFLIL